MLRPLRRSLVVTGYLGLFGGCASVLVSTSTKDYPALFLVGAAAVLVSFGLLYLAVRASD